MCQEDNLVVRNLRRQVGDFPETTLACGKVSGDQIYGFWSWGVMEHICDVGFIR